MISLMRSSDDSIFDELPNCDLDERSDMNIDTENPLEIIGQRMDTDRVRLWDDEEIHEY
jgi:hypothetical protein